MTHVEIRLDKETDRWKWTCPAGHRGWEPTNNHFWCADCARSSWDNDVDPEFDELRNSKTDENIHRDEISLVTPLGPYEGR